MEGLDIGQLKSLIIAPKLREAGFSDVNSGRTNFMAGIALAETNAAFLAQIGGPARGLWQTEPDTHDDCWKNFLNFRMGSQMVSAILGELPARFGGVPNPDALYGNLPYALLMAAVRFYRSPYPLPLANDAAGMNAAWKLGYNSIVGSGSIDEEHTALFQRAIDA